MNAIMLLQMRRLRCCNLFCSTPSQIQICSTLERALKSISTFSDNVGRNTGSGSSSSVFSASADEEEAASPLTGGGLAKPFSVPFRSSEKPMSVLELLQSTGFSQTDFNRILSKVPKIVCYNSNQYLKPKIDFLRSVGLSETDVVKMITSYPPILVRNLKNHIIPSFDRLITLLGGERYAVDFIKRHPVIFNSRVLENMPANLSTLQDLGVPNIPKLMNTPRFVRVLGGIKPSRFNKIVNDVMEMGFDYSSSYFEQAISAMAWHSEKTWESKLKFYACLGFSDKEILSMFKKQPILMSMSEKKITAGVQFYTQKFHWSPTQLSARPILLQFSLEKRIIPRCSVLQVLEARNKILKSVLGISLLQMNDKEFEEKYLIKYREEVPEVVDGYQGKLKFDEYTFDFCKFKNSDAK